MQHLILGGARSGKSQYAEQLAEASKKQVIYIATGTAGDEEMQERIHKHQTERPRYWQTIEEPILLADVLSQYAGTQNFLLVDCLTLWLNNILFDAPGNYQEDIFLQQKQSLLEILPNLHTDISLVSNEVGSGVVPMDKMSRRFVDEAGRLHQQLAKICSHVTLVTAGLPLALKH
ncbi:bifunctional adenosylcobinamide kinase/adenosylcobinamide-phosphate guanylyltransferase [Methylococcaceae bacterium CS1]|nr:bifunctional adenosylcobinamide kinase/adenosylcobinamide-phosphate guanylyltransferase [Methyloprofundus sp.]TXK96461.1 bifunctional adenosylcobinamide kinase/adenosylcobinamide-phosphate guanylyltransferase [Methylococcaceae bacterium CS4]TXK98872.1 bifunctional adenosylcobinamide kinase/adenosylcobinamide-phosphate guanylyltransferase [Methylococcaceae bacterium CS5]TXL05325.1 bifunctional adenosylcobinamide kinase/adenosylcobinamide-phosphate guanylyltransferase [Methylococcaceae bacteriu